MDQVKSLAPDIRWGDISLVLMNNRGMKELNCRYFSRNESTDTISLRYNPIPGDSEGLTGEVFVNVEEALAVGERRSTTTPAYELALYIAHGLNHLSGAVDTDDKSRRAMRRKERQWLTELEDTIEGLI